LRRRGRGRSLILAGFLSAPLVGAPACSGRTSRDDNPNRGVGGAAGGTQGAGGSGGTGRVCDRAGGGASGTGTAGAAGSVPEVCTLPKDPGPCNMPTERWWFNPQRGQCEPFTYGGCEGTFNNFWNLAQCREVCVPGTGAICGGRRCASLEESCCNASCGACSLPGEGCAISNCSGACAPMDAQGEGDCGMQLGYKWDGQACVSICGCSCVGGDCSRLVSSLDQCASAHDECTDPGCGDEQRALLDFINANKACSSAADCRSERVGCGITEDDCTGAVYLNTQADLASFGPLRDQYRACLGDRPNCATCARFDADADCIGGRCSRRSLGPPP
jgi:hypothetical protein